MVQLKKTIFRPLLVSAMALALALAPGIHAAEPQRSPATAIAPTDGEEKAARVVAVMLARYEYKKVPFDHALSARVFDNYLKTLDPDKLYFLQTDIAAFGNERDALIDEVQRGDLHLPFDIYNVYVRRIAERMAFAGELLDRGFNFDEKESFRARRDALPWAADEETLRDGWRKRVKNDWLRLKLAGERDPAIRSRLHKRYDHYLARAYQTKSEDVFQLFMDAYATSIDPHTNYLGLENARDLNEEMRLSIVGVGINLAQVGEYLVVREIVPGSPAALSGKLNIGDRVVGIGEGKSGPITEVVGWRIDDAVTLARGAAGSFVRLELMRGEREVNGKARVVMLPRKTVRFEDQAAKKTVLKIADGETPRTVAVISLPIFYEDFDARSNGEQDYKSAARDVGRLLREAKAEQVDGILLDLRDNGGGSLDEAIRLTGLFVGNGPVLQVRDAEGDVKVLRADASDVAWDGVLGVLINRRSASASEIFAAAMQDYGRGIVIGDTSFGKGTVQAIVDLDKLAKSEQPELGELKVTIAQFFRVNGESTQLHGVTPDILFPAEYDANEIGEASFENALSWDKIAPAAYARRSGEPAAKGVLQHLHEVRIAGDKDFQYLVENTAANRSRNAEERISLNERERKEERAQAPSKGAAGAGQPGKGGSVALNPPQDTGLDVGESSLAQVLAAEKAEKTFEAVELNEAASIVADAVKLHVRQTP